jgi:hypothetical protein
MVVGARTRGSQANWGRGLANAFYNRFASLIVGQRVEDLTSGFRAVRADKFREFLYLFPNGFSYPTTVTMSFFRAGYPVAYVPIDAGKRNGKSHLRPIRDGIRFLLIIFKVGTLYSPLKIFVPIAALRAALGLGYYLYTYFTTGRLTLGTIFMLSSALTIFLIGLVSEQITQLMYRGTSGPAAIAPGVRRKTRSQEGAGGFAGCPSSVAADRCVVLRGDCGPRAPRGNLGGEDKDLGSRRSSALCRPRRPRFAR